MCLKKQEYEINLFRGWFRIFFLAALILSRGFAATAYGDPSSPVWLEKKASSPMMPRNTERGKKKEGQGQMQEKDRASSSDKKGENSGEKKKEKRRAPMSRPAAYLLKTGIFPDMAADSSDLLNSVCWLKKPDKSFTRISLKQTEEGILAFDEAFQAGLYQLFLYYDAGVKDQTWYRHFSGLWFRNAGEDDFEEKKTEEKDREGLYQEEPLFHLKELTEDDENNFVAQRRHTGDTVPVQVLLRGEPLPGVPVTLTTKKGWEKTIVTDQDGRASFLLIKEVFHDKRIYKEAEPYLFKAVYSVDTGGMVHETPYNRQVYSATIRLMVYPTPYDWKSKDAGFYLFMGSTLAVIFAAAIRRKRIQTI